MILNSKKNKKPVFPGFTLVEIIIVVLLISILAGITVVVLDPAKRLADARNLQRSGNVAQILAAVKSFTSAPNQDLADLGSIATCPSTSVIGTSGINLSASLVDQYLGEVPTDPSGGTSANTGYTICRTANGRVEIAAPNAEEGETISARY